MEKTLKEHRVNNRGSWGSRRVQVPNNHIQGILLYIMVYLAYYGTLWYSIVGLTLRVQVPNNHILTKNLYYNYYYPKPKYLIIGYLDPLGIEDLTRLDHLRDPGAVLGWAKAFRVLGLEKGT